MITVENLLGAFALFTLRIINNSVGTINVIALVRQKRLLAFVLSFTEAFIFAVVIANVVKDLSNWLNILAYCGGFAAGSYVGMIIEARFIISYVTVTAITALNGHDIADAAREQGYAMTETIGEGRDGKVSILSSTVTRNHLPPLIKIIQNVNPKAFISIEEVRSVQRGYIPTVSRQGEGS